MKQPRLPKVLSERINVVAPEAKTKLMEITKRTGETLKEAVERLVDAEYNGLEGEREMFKFEVTDEDNLYFGRIGNLVAFTQTTVILDIDGEDVVFDKKEVKEIEGGQDIEF